MSISMVLVLSWELRRPGIGGGLTVGGASVSRLGAAVKLRRLYVMGVGSNVAGRISIVSKLVDSNIESLISPRLLAFVSYFVRIWFN
jgi:hypothetical protein